MVVLVGIYIWDSEGCSDKQGVQITCNEPKTSVCNNDMVVLIETLNWRHALAHNCWL